jgi:putative transposase
MRIPRSQTIGVTGVFHKMWRGHNREHVLEGDFNKNEYLRHLGDTYQPEIKARVEWHSYCLMGSHSHESGRCKKDESGELAPALRSLGNWMRNGHSRFGAGYNRRNARQGKVAYDRPKTTEIENEQALLAVMFYGDANPVRAGMVSHPSRYRHSSYSFYAYGKTNEHTKHLVPPPAYLALGETPSQRQSAYRSLCDAYLRDQGLIDDRPSENVESPSLVVSESGSGEKSAAPLSRGHPGDLNPEG